MGRFYHLQVSLRYTNHGMVLLIDLNSFGFGFCNQQYIYVQIIAGFCIDVNSVAVPTFYDFKLWLETQINVPDFNKICCP